MYEDYLTKALVGIINRRIWQISKTETLHELYTICQSIDFEETNQLIENARSDDEKTFIRIITDCILQEKQRKAIAENRFWMVQYKWNGVIMPEITRFYGIVIKMFFKPKEHEPSHIHALYGEYVGIFDITSHQMTEGDLPKRAQELVKEWLDLHCYVPQNKAFWNKAWL